MTTATFQAIGSSIGGAIGGPVGAWIGGTIGAGLGAYVDNLIISSLLAPDPPKLNDLSVQVSSYGRPIAMLFGEENRLAGNVIWSTGLVETLQGGKGAPEPEHYTYSTSLAVLLGEGMGDVGYERVEKIWANGKVIYDESIAGVAPLPPTDTVFGYFISKSFGYNSAFETMRFYPGSRLQLPDPSIQADKGVENTPRYKKSCYAVIDGLQLADFGNRLPNLEFQVLAKTGESAGDCVRRIVVRCGLDPDQVGTAQINAPVRGYVIGNLANGLGAIQPLALTHSFDIAEVYGSLRCQPRGSGVLGLIQYKHLGAHDARGSPEDRIRWPRIGETNLPNKASITFRNPERDLQEDTQTATRGGTGSSDAKVSYTVAVTLTANDGRALADRLLWEAVTARQTASTSVSDQMRDVEPARAYILESKDGTNERIKVVQKTRGANGVNKLEVRQERSEVYQSTAPGAVVQTPSNVPLLPGFTSWQPLDMPILRESDDDSGFYWATNGPALGWRGGDLWRSANGSSYVHVAQLPTETSFGAVPVALADGPTHIWDEANTIIVELDGEGESLSSATELEVLNGANLCWLGEDATGQDGELLQFRDAVLTTPPRTYTLSGLLRGRFGTEHATGTHGTNERLVLIQQNAAGMGRADFGAGDWNRERDYKAPTISQKVLEAIAQPFTNEGEGKRPYSPINPEGTRDGSNNLVIVATRRSRIPAPGLGYGPTPLGEAVELYEWDILDGADVVATYETSTPELDYTAAEQTADGLTPGDPVVGVLYQISDIRGRGHGLAFEV